jgi:hypothetical protein
MYERLNEERRRLKMLRKYIVISLAVAWVFGQTGTVLATDPCGGPYGAIDVPSGNIAAKTGASNTWVTPIGGTSTWTAINYGDLDSYQCNCVSDSIPSTGIRWVISYVTFVGGSNIGSPKTIIASSDPHTSVGVRLQLNDAGNPVEDGGFVQVASQNLDMVIPDRERYTQILTPGCSAPYPFGVYKQYKARDYRDGYSLSFDHCQVNETSTWPGFTQNGCNFPTPTIGGTLGLSSNIWTGYDHVWFCNSANPILGPCTSSWSLDWRIRTTSGPGAWHVYHTPTYTFSAPAGGRWSSLTASRSEL